MQTIRFVGGPQHGRTLELPESAHTAEIPVFAHGELLATARYYRRWLTRSTPTMRLHEQVMLAEGLPQFSAAAQERWQQLRTP